MDKNDLSYWFPAIRDAGLPVPRTTIMITSRDLTPLLDGNKPKGFLEFCCMLQAAMDDMDYPCFLRTGHGSGKHDWRRTCFVVNSRNIPQHVANLVKWSNAIDFLGLPTRTWAVRELIRTTHAFYAFMDMPVTREFRVFTKGGKLCCIHPYWPPEVIRSPSIDNWREVLRDLSQIDDYTQAELYALARKAVAALDGGDWSVDFLQAASKKWFLIDMAEARHSWHWPDCPHNDKED